MTLNGKRVLVAGGTGMAGTAVLRQLAEQFPGAAIRATWHKHHADRTHVEWVQADLRKREDAVRACAGCDVAALVAATTSGARGMLAAPWEAVDDNVTMNVQLLEALHHAKVKRVVFVSSATVYQPFQGAIKEDDLDLNQDPHSAHFGVGWGMRFIEKLCRFWHEKTGMETVIARAANIFGPRAPFDPARSNVVPALIRKAVDRLDPFEVWGSPDVVRDVIFVDEFARAIVLMLAADEIKHETFNVGSGTGTSVGALVRFALEAAGHQPGEVRWVSQAPQTIGHRVLDCSKAEARLHWRPKSSIAEGIHRTTEWWKENRRTWTR